MYCPTCNTPNRDDAKFCKTCGHPLHANVGAQALVSTPDEAEEAPVGADLSRLSPRAPQRSEAERVSMLRPPAPGETNAEEIEDISGAPTESRSPERMAGLHHRIWQQDQESEAQYIQATSSVSRPRDGVA